jgi:hypothetical protein
MIHKIKIRKDNWMTLISLPGRRTKKKIKCRSAWLHAKHVPSVWKIQVRGSGGPGDQSGSCRGIFKIAIERIGLIPCFYWNKMNRVGGSQGKRGGPKGGAWSDGSQWRNGVGVGVSGLFDKAPDSRSS